MGMDNNHIDNELFIVALRAMGMCAGTAGPVSLGEDNT